MENDDEQVGRILSRREALLLLGAAMLQPGSATAALLPACVVRPEQMEGPYFVEEKLNRSDIRSDPGSGTICEGTRLDLAFQVSQVRNNTCRPLPGALVDVWQCDALGVYSDVRDTQARFNTVGQKFLRGQLLTDAQGLARFVTVYPGWYEGRTVHIHFKIRTPAGPNRTYDFTSQLYFDDTITDVVMRRQPYATKGDARRVPNERDGIFRNGGAQLMLPVSAKGDGYTGMFDIGLQIG